MQRQNQQKQKSKKQVKSLSEAKLVKRQVHKPVSRPKLKAMPVKEKKESPLLNPDAFPVFNLEGLEVSKVKLDSRIFDGEVNSALLYQALNMYRANQRQGTASTKTRGEVSGGGIKPWRQKGTGRARVGSIRSPLWRHGGITFGPHPRDYGYSLSARTKNEALKSSLNEKLKTADLMFLQDLKLSSHKTKDFFKILAKLNIKDKALILTKDLDINLIRACRNISFINVGKAIDVNAYEVLRHKKLIATVEALGEISRRIKGTK